MSLTLPLALLALVIAATPTTTLVLVQASPVLTHVDPALLPQGQVLHSMNGAYLLNMQSDGTPRVIAT